MITTLSLILISATITFTVLALLLIVMRQRLTRITHSENRISDYINALDTTRLQAHLQGINISVVEIDAEVAALKQDIVIAAHKHHLKVDETDTQPDTPFKSQETQEKLIRVLEKQEQRPARVS